MNPPPNPAPHRHLTVHELLRLFEGEGSLEALARRALAHLRALCPECDAAYRDFERIRDRRRRRRRAAYGAVLDSAQHRIPELVRCHQAEIEAAERDLRVLLDLPHTEALALITEKRRRQVREPCGWRMRSPHLVQRLLEEARIALRRSPAEALELVERADAVVHRVPRPHHGEAFVERLATRVSADRANVLRVLGELQGASVLWHLIRERLERWPVDTDDEADLLSLEASLRQDQRRFGDAERLLARAERLYRRLEDAQGFGKILIQRGNVANIQGESHAAADLYRQAGELLSAADSPRLYLLAQHGLALALCDSGEPASAATVLERNRPLYGVHRDTEAQSRLADLEGRIAWGLGDHARAESCLLRARNSYLIQRQGFNAASATLDLAALYLECGRPREVKPLAEQMLPIFQTQGLHSELIAALLVFRQAALAERLSAELLDRLRRYLLVARNDRSCRFEDSGRTDAADPADSPTPYGAGSA